MNNAAAEAADYHDNRLRTAPLLTYRRELYQMRHFELLAEFFYLLHYVPLTEEYAAKYVRDTSRDYMISLLLDIALLRRIDAVNCPTCWARPNQPCLLQVVGIDQRIDLPWPYHQSRKRRAIQKVGLH